jgi:hypothetical protein
MAAYPGANTFADSLNANFKIVYADKIENLIPDGVKLTNRISFSGREAQLGNLYSQPLILGLEHGVTFAGSTDDAFALQAPIAGQLKEAQVRGSQMVLRSVLGYAAAARAAGGGQRAFEDSTKFLVQNMMRSMVKKLEIELLYGGVGYGVVASISSNTISIVTAEWAPGIWAGAKNLPLEIRSSSGTLRGTANVVSVNMDARTVTVDLMPAGVVATDVLWHKGAYDNEFAGIHQILTNTGTLFNINAAQYDLFTGNTVSAANGPLSFALIQDAIARGVEKGLDSDVVVLVNPRSWADLLTEQAAMRMYDQSYRASVSESGSQEITFHGQNGKVEIVPSIYVKSGKAYVLAMDDFMRVGSTDITFRRPGQGDDFFRELENNAGYELRAYTDQAVFCMAPGRSTLITDIVNSN